MRIDLQLAALADVDPRTAEKALREGLAAVRGKRRRDRLASVAPSLGVTFPVAAKVSETDD